MIDIPNIGDNVEFVDKRYDGLQVIVSGIQCNRIAVERKDAHKRIWTAYVDVSELKEVKE